MFALPLPLPRHFGASVRFALQRKALGTSSSSSCWASLRFTGLNTTMMLMFKCARDAAGAALRNVKRLLQSQQQARTHRLTSVYKQPAKRRNRKTEGAWSLAD